MLQYQAVSSPLVIKGIGKQVNIVENNSILRFEGVDFTINIQKNTGTVKIDGMNHQVSIVENRGQVSCEGMGHTIFCSSGNPPVDNGMNNTVQCGNGSAPNYSAGQGSWQPNQVHQPQNGQGEFNLYFGDGAVVHFGQVFYAQNTPMNQARSHAKQPAKSLAKGQASNPVDVNPAFVSKPSGGSSKAESSYAIPPSVSGGIPSNVHQEIRPPPSYLMRCNYPMCPNMNKMETFAKLSCYQCAGKPQDLDIHMSCLAELWKPVEGSKVCSECLHCNNQIQAIVVFKD